MNKYRFFIRLLLPAILLALLFTSCRSVDKNITADETFLNVSLYLKDYTPKPGGINPDLKGREMCLANIRNDARNTTNFSYYSKDIRIQYLLSNRANTPVQLIPSFFWYAYQKAFEQAGIKTSERCSGEIPELWIIFQSFTDEELQFKVTLLENRETIFQKDMRVVMPPAADHSPAMLQTRAYDMIDLTISTILNDPSFQAAFL